MAMKVEDIPTYTLNDGLTLPTIGFGTYKLNGVAGVSAILNAVQCGSISSIRHITGPAYPENRRHPEREPDRASSVFPAGRAARGWNKAHHIVTESWSPLGRKSKDLLENATLHAAAEKYRKIVSQVDPAPAYPAQDDSNFKVFVSAAAVGKSLAV